MKKDVKKIGDDILAYVRSAIHEAAKDDVDFEFKLNRWVFSRLQIDSRKQSRPIKKKLWDSGMQSCQACGEKFDSIKGVHIHRKDDSLGYSFENCELMHRRCHQKKT